jgi:hypothetical protein
MPRDMFVDSLILYKTKANLCCLLAVVFWSYDANSRTSTVLPSLPLNLISLLNNYDTFTEFMCLSNPSIRYLTVLAR